MRDVKTWWTVVLFAIAMAWVEAAVVFYLRTLVGRIDPYQARPLPVADPLGRVELAREAATLVMLACIGWLAGKNGRVRVAYGAIAFGTWDIWYYVFLKAMTDWPHSVLDWDILFLIPLPWWGPVVAPVSISLLLIVGGTMISQFAGSNLPLWPGTVALFLNLIGVILSLFVFMSDALRVAHQGSEAIRNVLPVGFNWTLFALAWLLMSVPILDIARQCVVTGLPNRR